MLRVVLTALQAFLMLTTVSAGSLRTAKAEATLPGLGRVHIAARLNGDVAVVSITDDAAQILFNTSLSGVACCQPAVGVRVFTGSDLPQPLIVVVVHGLAGDGLSVRPVFIARLGNKLTEVLPRDLVDRYEDAVCIGNLGHGQPPGVAVWRHLQGDEAAIGPHHYRLTVFRWSSGPGFVSAISRETQRPYNDFSGAAAELGFQCGDVLNAMQGE
jgi:hypothetical protein